MASARLKTFLDSLALAGSLGRPFRATALEVALQAAREMEDPGQRSRALLLLHLDLDEPLKTKVLRESLEAAVEIGSESEQLDVLRLIAKQLAQIKQRNVKKASMYDVAAVIRAGDMRPQGSIARRFLHETAGKRGRLLGDVAPKLGNNEIPRYFDLAIGLSDPAGRAFALTGLAPRLEVDVREDAFRMVLEATRGVRFPQSRSSLIRRIGADLPEEMLSEAFEITLGLPQNLRSGPLSVLTPRLDIGQLEIAARATEDAPRLSYASESVARRSPAPDPLRLALTSWFENLVRDERSLRELRTILTTGLAREDLVSSQVSLESISRELLSLEPTLPRFVSTGFSMAEDPEKPLASSRPLLGDQWYFFWLEVGELVAGAIDEEASSLPLDLLPPDAELKVVLFTNETGFEIDPLSRFGVLRVKGKDSIVEVVKSAAIPLTLSADAAILRRRLFFPVRTPEA